MNLDDIIYNIVPNKEHVFNTDPVKYVEIEYKGRKWNFPILEFTVDNKPTKCYGIQLAECAFYSRTEHGMVPAFMQYFKKYIEQCKTAVNMIKLKEWKKFNCDENESS